MNASIALAMNPGDGGNAANHDLDDVRLAAGGDSLEPLRCVAVVSDRGRTEYDLVHLVEADRGLVAYPLGKGSRALKRCGLTKALAGVPGVVLKQARKHLALLEQQQRMDGPQLGLFDQGVYEEHEVEEKSSSITLS